LRLDEWSARRRAGRIITTSDLTSMSPYPFLAR
jgi:hypothetical protein